MRSLSSSLIKIARLPAVTADASDVITTICDMGACQSAIAIVSFEYTTDSVTDLAFWTSSSDTCGVTGTAQTATTNTVAVEIASDADGLQAWNGNTQITDLSVSSNMIASLAQDGVVAIELPSIRRYLYAQYNGAGTGSTLGITFVGLDGGQDACEGARTAY
jgi:hypothetical protein